MKAKHLMIVSLLLAIITMGVVSASDDISVDDGLAANDVTEDSIDEAPVDEVIGVSEDSDSVDSSVEIRDSAASDDGALGDPDDISAEWHTDITDKNGTVVTVWNFPENGNLIVDVNGTQQYNEQFSPTWPDEDVGLSKLNIDSDGIYLVSARFVTENSVVFDLGQRNITVNVNWDEFVTVNPNVDIMHDSDNVVEVHDSNNLNGTLKIYIDNVLYYDDTFYGDYSEEAITVYDLNLYANATLGTHSVRAVYMRNGAETHNVTKQVEFMATPFVYTYYAVSVGEKDNLVATHAKTFTGNATLYNAVWDDANMKWVKGSEVIGIAEFSNGVATIPFPSLSKGTFYFIVNITDWIPKYDDDDLVTVEVKENTPEISANVSASEITYGETIVVKMSGATFGTRAGIIIDEFDWYDPIFDENGNLTRAFPDLAVGTHKIKIQYDYNDKFYSNSFYITVKEVPAPAPTPAPGPAPGPAPQGQTSTPAKNDVVKLTLKKVKVKKSAKKLVLQATLKINGKAVKGKVIKFKFNKKTYKAKTNKKGVAKVTIKKSVLKKLKAGKKVTYQATYDKTTVKKTVKVKK